MEGLNDKIMLADQGDLDVGLELARYFLFESDEDADDDVIGRVKGYISSAVDAGRLEAVVMVAQMYEQGRGVQPDREKAIFWYRKAAEMGDAGSMAAVERLTEGELDQKQVFRNYAIAAQKGDPLGYFRIGDMYAEGRFVEKDPREAFNSYVLAYNLAAKDKDSGIYADILMKIAECCMEGKGVEANILNAQKLFEEANFRLRVLVNGGDNDRLEEYRLSEKCLRDIEEKIKTPCFNML